MTTPREQLIKKYSEKQYIGDSVYIYFDGYHFILETHNGYSDDPRNRIALDPIVLENLSEYCHSCYRDFQTLSDWEGKQREENKEQSDESK